MQKIYIHIGLPKTGTTALQAYLSKAEAQLKQKKIHYITTELTLNFCLSVLARYTHLDKNFESLFFKDATSIAGTFHMSKTYSSINIQKKYFLAMQENIKNNDTIILSSEFFSYMTSSGLASADLATFLKHFFADKDVFIVCYLRTPEKIIASLYKEFIKEGYCNIKEEMANLAFITQDSSKEWLFSDCIQNLKKNQFAVFSPQTILDFYAEIFGKGKIITRVYKEESFDIIDDFLSLFSLKKNIKYLPTTPVNTSLSTAMANYRVAYGDDASSQHTDIASHALLAKIALQSLGKLPPALVDDIQHNYNLLYKNYNIKLAFEHEKLQTMLQSQVSDFETFVCSALGKLSKQNNEILRQLKPIASPPADYIQGDCPTFSSPIPDRKSYAEHLEQILASRWLTSCGPYVRQLEQALENTLRLPFVTLCANDTIMLLLLLYSENLQGKRIALSPCMPPRLLSALRWTYCHPVFIDLDPHTLSPSLTSLQHAFQHTDIAAAIIHPSLGGTDEQLDKIYHLCHQHGVLCILEGSDSFGVQREGRSILNFGDYAICSLHASHIFHTAEGGLIVSHTTQNKNRLELLRSSGSQDGIFTCYGINGHMSELHAALGLSLLPLLDEGIVKRKQCASYYDSNLKNISASLFARRMSDVQSNYAQYPCIFPTASAAQYASDRLAREGIFLRQPYSPLLNQLSYLEEAYSKSCPIAEDIAARLLHLPLFDDLPIQRQETVIHIVNELL